MTDEKIVVGCGGIVVLLVTIACIILLPTHHISVKVVQTAWVHEQQVQNYIPRRYGSWIEQVPSDAYDQSSWEKVRSTSTSCTKIGKTSVCTRTDHYDTWVDYTADRWDYERSQVTNGSNNDPRPYWPTPDFQACEQLNCERLGGTTERYTITYRRDDDSEFVCDTNAALYGEFQVEQTYGIEDGAFVHIPRCDSLAK